VGGVGRLMAVRRCVDQRRQPGRADSAVPGYRSELLGDLAHPARALKRDLL